MRFQTENYTIAVCFLLSCAARHSRKSLRYQAPNLRVAVEDALGHDRVTQQTLRRLERLDATGRKVANLTGLEFAVNMAWLFIGNNEITNLTPLSRMGTLETLHIYSNPIFDISPLASLTNFKYINAAGCKIADITPFANLTQLTEANLSWNRITDIMSLAHLNKLKWLEIHNNPIIDYQILDGLPLDHVVYDQVCDMPFFPLRPRLDNRSFPSVFSAWGSIYSHAVLNQPQLSGIEQMSQHDLYFHTHIFGDYFLNVNNRWVLRIPTSYFIQHRDDYIKLNPNMIFILEIRIRDADKRLFPENSNHWVKGTNNRPIFGGSADLYLLDFTNSDVQDMIRHLSKIDLCSYSNLGD